MPEQNSMVLIYDTDEKNPSCIRDHSPSFNLRIKGTWPDTKYFCTHIMEGMEVMTEGTIKVMMCGDVQV